MLDVCLIIPAAGYEQCYIGSFTAPDGRNASDAPRFLCLAVVPPGFHTCSHRRSGVEGGTLPHHPRGSHARPHGREPHGREVHVTSTKWRVELLLLRVRLQGGWLMVQRQVGVTGLS